MISTGRTLIAVFTLMSLVATSARAQPAVGVAASGTLAVKGLVEKKVAQLPPGPLFWGVENFATRAEAQAAAGPTGLVAEAKGKIWLFTLGPSGGSSTGGFKVVEVGPIPTVVASEYLLRINEASGSPGSITPI